jgi:hypothetical protein
MSNETLSSELFNLVGYLLTSAHGLYEEPPGYGPFRLLDTTGRLLAIMQAYGLSDSFLDELKEWADQERFGTSSDEQLRLSLDQKIMQYAAELKRRNKETIR